MNPVVCAHVHSSSCVATSDTAARSSRPPETLRVAIGRYLIELERFPSGLRRRWPVTNVRG
jgi:hypothetical protein